MLKFVYSIADQADILLIFHHSTNESELFDFSGIRTQIVGVEGKYADD